MSTFQDLLNIINGLPSGTEVVITKEWCSKHNLVVNDAVVRDWGK